MHMANDSPRAVPGDRPKGSKKAGVAAPVKAYLVAYNLLSAAGWAYVLFLTVSHLSTQEKHWPITIQRYFSPVYIPSFVPSQLQPLYKRAATTFAAVGTTTAYVQTAAALEVLHVLLGFVRSPLPTTAMQVASRLILVWGIADRFTSAQQSPFYASMVLSWSVTEVIRYAFYAASLIGTEPRFLVWLRYTTFYILYPTGASSEAFVNFVTLPITRPFLTWDLYSIVRGAMFLIWWPGLYVMYTYMIKQRRKVFAGPGRTLGAKPKST